MKRGIAVFVLLGTFPGDISYSTAGIAPSLYIPTSTHIGNNLQDTIIFITTTFITFLLYMALLFCKGNYHMKITATHGGAQKI